MTGRVAGYKVYELQRVDMIQRLPVAEPEAVAALAEEVGQVRGERRMARAMAKKGVEQNRRVLSDEEKSERAIRRRPVNRPFMLG